MPSLSHPDGTLSAMTPWTAPAVDRLEPTGPLGERQMLQAWLDYERTTLLRKCSGLDAQQLATASVPPSTLTLHGLVRHMTEVERSWFRRRFSALDVPALYYTDERPDGDFDDLADADVVADLQAFHQECLAADAAVQSSSLDEAFVHGSTQETLSLRWIYVHMIEEYARHNGHADLLREAIDGVVGE
jgi:uncharacterized damage-inducible protein DinB